MRALILLLLLSLGPCARAPDPVLPGPLDAGALEARQIACERGGGSFAPVTRDSTLMICFRTPADANRPCRSGADCEGVCLARSRTCAPSVPLLGCHEIVTDSGQIVLDCLGPRATGGS